MTNAIITVVVAVFVTMFLGLLATFNLLAWEDFIAWIVVIPICLGIIGYAWHKENIKKAGNHG